MSSFRTPSATNSPEKKERIIVSTDDSLKIEDVGDVVKVLTAPDSPPSAKVCIPPLEEEGLKLCICQSSRSFIFICLIERAGGLKWEV